MTITDLIIVVVIVGVVGLLVNLVETAKNVL